MGGWYALWERFAWASRASMAAVRGVARAGEGNSRAWNVPGGGKRRGRSRGGEPWRIDASNARLTNVCFCVFLYDCAVHRLGWIPTLKVREDVRICCF